MTDHPGVVTRTGGIFADSDPVYKGENYSYSTTDFFKTRGGKLAETLVLENDDRYSWPQEFSVIVNSYSI